MTKRSICVDSYTMPRNLFALSYFETVRLSKSETDGVGFPCFMVRSNYNIVVLDDQRGLILLVPEKYSKTGR